MFRIKRLLLDTLHEHVIVIHEKAVHDGNLGFNPLDRATCSGIDPVTAATARDHRRAQLLP